MKKLLGFWGVLWALIALPIFFSSCEFGYVTYSTNDATTTSTTVAEISGPHLEGRLVCQNTEVWYDNALWRVMAISESSFTTNYGDVSPTSNAYQITNEGTNTVTNFVAGQLLYSVSVPAIGHYRLLGFCDQDMDDICDPAEWTTALFTNGMTNVNYLGETVSNLDIAVALAGKLPVTNTNNAVVECRIFGMMDDETLQLQLVLSNHQSGVHYYGSYTSGKTNETDYKDFFIYAPAGEYEFTLFFDNTPLNHIYNYTNASGIQEEVRTNFQNFILTEAGTNGIVINVE